MKRFAAAVLFAAMLVVSLGSMPMNARAAVKSAETASRTKSRNSADTTSVVVKAQSVDTSAVAEVTTYSSAAYGDYTEEDMEAFYRCVESEAGDQGEYGKMLVADVILNRVADSSFPDSIYGVVFQQGQFSVVTNGSYYRVEVSEETKEACRKVLENPGCSQGALYFMCRRYSSARGIAYFDTLEFVMEYGDHEFFK